MSTSHKVLSITIAVLLAGWVFPLRAAENAAPQITGKVETVGGIQVLSLWGTPRERGFAHGWLLAEQVFEMAEEGLTPILAKGGQAMVQLGSLVAAGFSFSSVETEELEGLVEGIGKRLPGRKVAGLDRPPGLAELKLINTYGDWYELGCSSAAVWGKLTADGKPAVVRNFDFMPLRSIARWQHLRVVAPGRDGKARGWVGVGFPAAIGPVTAMNQEGVYIAIHDVWIKPSVKDYIQGNVPRLVALRRILEETAAPGAVEKAAGLCRSWNTLFGNNFMVATPDVSTGLAAGVIEYDTREDRERGATLRGTGAAGAPVLEYLACSNGHRARGTDSCGRYDSLIEACRERTGKPFDRAALEDLVSRAAVPSGGRPVEDAGVATLHQAVALTGERTMRVRILTGRDKNIRDMKWVEFRTDALLAGLPRPAAAKTD